MGAIAKKMQRLDLINLIFGFLQDESANGRIHNIVYICVDIRVPARYCVRRPR